MDFTDKKNEGQAHDHNRRYYRTEIPNIVDDLGLSPIALRLYLHIKRVAGANPAGRCYQGARKLRDVCKMSLGSVTSAKRELLKPRKELGGKALIKSEGKFDTIVEGKKKATDCFSVTDIWKDSLAYYQNLKAARSNNEHQPIVEQGAFTDAVQMECSSECSPDERKKEPLKNKPNDEITQREKEQSHSQANSNFVGLEDDVIDRSNVTKIDSPTDEIIEAVPVFDDEQPARSGGGEWLDKKFGVTDEMRAWAASNISSNIDTEYATRKFFLYYESDPKRITLSNWKLWMLKERPERGGAGRNITASEQRTAAFKDEAEQDLFADFDENESFSDMQKRIIPNYHPRNDGRPLTASEQRMEAFKREQEIDLFAHVTD
ncbi:MAG: hypothetical protein QOC96_146 [Acidobacteriota bacterium]|jgi:hypothetical protein|nr:hypothetical protein [Acidobacteriota bacterium]